MSKQAEAGKGSKPRQQQDQDAFSSGWDRIFGKHQKSSEVVDVETNKRPSPIQKKQNND